MYDNNHNSSQTEKILNVALSRAQQECIIIGDVAKIQANHSKTSLVRKMLNYLESHEFPFHSVEYFSDSLSQVTDMNQALGRITNISNPDGLNIFSDQNFYQYFQYDIKEAQQEIIIVSPFMTIKRINQLMHMLDAARRRQVNIFVMTRHPEAQEGVMSEQSREAMAKLAAQDIVVLPMRNNLHQKLAFLDRRVFWAGSLNILSQRNSRESMFRQSASENAITQLLANLSFDKNIGRIGENNLRKCERCTSCGAWYWREGKQIYCLNEYHDSANYTPRVEMSGFQSRYQDGGNRYRVATPYCPVHKIQMILRRRNGGDLGFWGCPKYKSEGCKITRTAVNRNSKHLRV